MPFVAVITDHPEQANLLPRLFSQQAITVETYTYNELDLVPQTTEVVFADYNGSQLQTDALILLQSRLNAAPISALIHNRELTVVTRAIRTFASDIFHPTGHFAEDSAEVISSFYRLQRKRAHSLAQQKELHIKLKNSAHAVLSPKVKKVPNTIQKIEQPVLILDSDNRIVGINSAAQLLMGLSEEDVYGRRVEHFLMLTEDERKNIREGKSFRGEFSASSFVEMSVGYTITPRFDDNGAMLGAMVIFKDITEDKIRRVQAEKSEKMQTLGEIAAAISHEVKNPLAGIKSMVQAISVDLDPKTEMYQYVNQISQEVSRINKFIEDTFAFARHKRQRIVKIAVPEIIDSVLALLAENFKSSGVQVFKHYEPNLPMLRVDADQIRQVFLNVVMNAVEAMNQANGGLGATEKKLEITAHQTIVFTGGETRPYVETLFHDTGPGAPSQVLSKVFDPFFTTKSSGTGLGLAICYKIIHEHHGQIELLNRRGGGATVSIRLPVLFLSRFEDKLKDPDVALATNASQNGAQEGNRALVQNVTQEIKSREKSIAESAVLRS
ncbi:MAG: ATP-binding protein [Chloroherpetonaceae bacterium]|nr:ATP-binding protein [Chloroherpetonaceae bacterium]